jgi:hypothetical protein
MRKAPDANGSWTRAGAHMPKELADALITLIALRPADVVTEMQQLEISTA